MKSFVILFLFLHSFAYGGFEQRSMSARGKAMGGATSTLSGDAWSAAANPATLTGLTSNQFSFTSSPRPFGLRELSSSAFAIGVPTDIGAFGCAARNYGFDFYKETSLSCCYATVISKLSFGAEVTFDHVAIERYGSAGTVEIAAGLFSNITSQLYAGVVMRNMTSAMIGAAREKLPQVCSAGISYLPLHNVMLACEYEKQLGFNPSPHLGMEYRVVESFAVRAGISEEPNISSGGIGITFGFMEFDYALSLHETLGWSHEFSMTIAWGGRHE
jgi:hypothetical protein